MSTGIKKFKYAEILSRVQRNFNLCLSDLLIYDIFFKIIATVIGGWGLFILAVAGGIAFLLDGFSAFILNSLGENPVLVIAAVCVLLAFYGLTAAVLTFIGFAVNCLLVTRLYFDISNRNGLRLMNNPAAVTANQSIQALRRKLVWAAALTALVITAISSYFIIENAEKIIPVLNLTRIA